MLTHIFRLRLYDIRWLKNKESPINPRIVWAFYRFSWSPKISRGVCPGTGIWRLLAAHLDDAWLGPGMQLSVANLASWIVRRVALGIWLGLRRNCMLPALCQLSQLINLAFWCSSPAFEAATNSILIRLCGILFHASSMSKPRRPDINHVGK